MAVGFGIVGCGMISNFHAQAIAHIRGAKIVACFDAFPKSVDTHSELFHFTPTRAGGMAFMRYNMPINSTKLSDKLRLEKSVFIIPGDCFGMDHYLRIGIGGEKGHLLAGLDLIDETLNEL